MKICRLSLFLLLIVCFLLILRPAFDCDALYRHVAESADEGAGKATVRDERDIEVDGGAAYLVAIGQLTGRKVLRDVDDHINLMVVEHVDGLRLTVFRRPVDGSVGYAVSRKITGYASGGILTINNAKVENLSNLAQLNRENLCI